MSLKDKFTENKNLARELAARGLLHASCNRYYYSALQKFMVFNEENLNYVYDGSQRSTHVALLEHFSDKMTELGRDDSRILIKSKNVESAMKSMKKIRVKADYKQESITQSDLNRIEQDIQNYNKYLGEVKNLIT